MTTTIAAIELQDKGQNFVDLAAQLVAATDTTYQFYNTGNEIVVVGNQSAGNRTLTVKSAVDPFGRGGVSADDMAVVIPASKIGFTSFLNPASFNVGGLCTFTLDASATTTVGVIRLRKLR